MNSLVNKIWKFRSAIFSIGFFFVLCDLVELPSQQKLTTALRLTGIVSSIFSGIIIGYLAAFSIQFRREKRERFPVIHELTQQVHNFRRILHILFNHEEFWPENFVNYMKDNYKRLSFFDIREMTNPMGIIKNDVNKYYDDDNFGSLKQLYLEIDSVVAEKHPDQALYSDYDEMIYFRTYIVTKWHRHNCGNGLWYFFDDKFNDFENNFNFLIFRKLTHDSANSLAKKIDEKRFEDFDLSPKNLAELGTYMHSFVFKKLFFYQVKQSEGFPILVSYLYLILTILLLAGVVIPVICLIYELNENYILYSIILTLTIAIYILLTFYSKIKRLTHN